MPFDWAFRSDPGVSAGTLFCFPPNGFGQRSDRALGTIGAWNDELVLDGVEMSRYPLSPVGT